jgi:hypothetical protein
MEQITVVWDDRNRYHITVEHAERGISEDDVEDVLRDPRTQVTALPTGYDLYIGRTRSGRLLRIVAMGEREVYPRSARPMPEQRWRTQE